MSFREKKGFFGRLTEKLADVINVRPEIDEEMFDDIEEVLITSDIGMETTMKIAWGISTFSSTAEASSGSTLLMNFASIFRFPVTRAQFSSAMYRARGPRSDPPIPI